MFQQFAILIEGMNPDAGGPLTDNELSRVRAAMRNDEHLCGFVRGRMVGAGTGLWVMTEQRLLLLKAGRRSSVDALMLSSVQRVTLEAGRYGHTVAVYTADQRRSLFAADDGLAGAFVAALSRSLPASAETSARPTSMTPDQSADVSMWVSWSRARLLPAPRQGVAENLVLLREAATLHEQGMLGTAEYGALKSRLLDAA